MLTAALVMVESHAPGADAQIRARTVAKVYAAMVMGGNVKAALQELEV